MTQADLSVASDSTRGNWHNLKYKEFHLNVRKNFFFNCEGDQALDRLPREAIESPLLAIFKA